jgi:hypothetical protein
VALCPYPHHDPAYHVLHAAVPLAPSAMAGLQCAYGAVAKLATASDLKSAAFGLVGSSPTSPILFTDIVNVV